MNNQTPTTYDTNTPYEDLMALLKKQVLEEVLTDKELGPQLYSVMFKLRAIRNKAFDGPLGMQIRENHTLTGEDVTLMVNDGLMSLNLPALDDRVYNEFDNRQTVLEMGRQQALKEPSVSNH